MRVFYAIRYDPDDFGRSEVPFVGVLQQGDTPDKWVPLTEEEADAFAAGTLPGKFNGIVGPAWRLMP